MLNIIYIYILYTSPGSWIGRASRLLEQTGKLLDRTDGPSDLTDRLSDQSASLSDHVGGLSDRVFGLADHTDVAGIKIMFVFGRLEPEVEPLQTDKNLFGGLWLADGSGKIFCAPRRANHL